MTRKERFRREDEVASFVQDTLNLDEESEAGKTIFSAVMRLLELKEVDMDHNNSPFWIEGGEFLFEA